MVSKRPGIFKRAYIVDKKLQYGLIAGIVAFIVAMSSLFFIAIQTSQARLLDAISMHIPSEINVISSLVESEFEFIIFFIIANAIVTGIFVLIAFVSFSHRIAGPIFSLKKSMQNIIDGNKAEPVKFRKEDFFQDLAKTYNKLIEKLNK